MSAHIVAVDLIMRSQINHAVHGAIASLKTLTSAVIAANAELKLLGQIGGTGLGSLALAGGAFYGLEKMAKAGWELVKVQKDMAIAGIEATDVQKAYNKAWEVTKQYGNINPAEALKMQASARQIYTKGDKPFHEVIDEMGEIWEAASFLKVFQGGTHKNLMNKMFVAMRSGEMAGKFTTEDAGMHIANLVGMETASNIGGAGHGGFSIEKYAQAQNAAGVSLRMANDEFKYGMFPAMANAMPGAGVALMTLWQKFGAGTRMKGDSLQALNKLGLIDTSDKSKLKYNKKGDLTGIKDMSAFKGHSDFLANPAKWTHDVFEPALKKMFGNDVAGQTSFIGKIAGDRNAMKALVEMMQMWPTLLQDAKNVFTASAEYRKSRHTYKDQNMDFQMQRAQTAWQALNQGLGAGAVPMFTNMMRRVANGLSVMAEFVGKHPGVGEAVAGVLQVLAVGLGALGVVLVGTALVGLGAYIGTGGLLLVGLPMLAAAIITFWNRIRGIKDTAPEDYGGARYDPGFLDRTKDRLRTRKMSVGAGGIANIRAWGAMGEGDELPAARQSAPFDGSIIGKKVTDVLRTVPDTVNAEPVATGTGSKVTSALGTVPSHVDTSGFIAGLSSLITQALGRMSFGAGGSGFTGGGGGGGPRKMSYPGAPPNAGGSGGQTIQANLHIDGERFASVTGRAMAAHYEMPTQAPHHDGSAGWSSPDHGTITT